MSDFDLGLREVVDRDERSAAHGLDVDLLGRAAVRPGRIDVRSGVEPAALEDRP